MQRKKHKYTSFGCGSWNLLEETVGTERIGVQKKEKKKKEYQREKGHAKYVIVNLQCQARKAKGLVDLNTARHGWIYIVTEGGTELYEKKSAR